MDDNMIPLSLATLCQGELEAKFQNMYPTLLSQCREGGKASVSITIEFEKIKDTSIMVKTKFKLTPKFPATSKASICQFDDDFQVKTEPSIKRSTVVNLFEGEKVNEQ
jgi:hypothetical protein